MLGKNKIDIVNETPTTTKFAKEVLDGVDDVVVAFVSVELRKFMVGSLLDGSGSVREGRVRKEEGSRWSRWVDRMDGLEKNCVRGRT